LIVIVFSALAIAAAILAPRYVRHDALRERLGRAEPTVRRFGPLCAAIASIAIVWFVWDAVVPIPKVHDESSYLLQADIFASGRWTAPSPPVPDFFEQPHVQVVPAVASKYPPGHALLLSIGALVRFPPLVPLLLTGIAAAMLFALATRLTNPWIALLTWTIWITAPIVLRFQPSYFSELTTTVLVLGSWWGLLTWRETRSTRWLLLMALAIGWGAITRPLTMLAFAIPIGVVVVRDVVRLRLWRDFGLAFVVGVAVLSMLPLWNARTTGDWKLSPIELYRRDYLPFDKIGFTPDTSAPRRSVSPVLKTTYDYFLVARKQQRWATLPQIVTERVVNLTTGPRGLRQPSSMFDGPTLPLLLFALLGLFFMTPPLRFAALSGLVLFVVHLSYAHWAPWTIYYLEMTPLIAAITAVGIWRALERITVSDGSAKVGAVFVFVVLAAFAVPVVGTWRRDHRARSALDRQFARELQELPRRSILFVRYSPRLKQHMAVVLNYADLDAAPVWVVHDLGARNEELKRKAPGRQTFEFDEDVLTRLR
jgi:hypothetical protein